ncbi:hypothetical protein MNAN1_001812 [Malassezia nana]|uniref:Uncharacterized protein n=1 Tax=Malassezia nana TaxID=180528 RepID=A0AAF0EM03_9BASI|nr:hypothetical protein MNAN1_001812 [Malassezia nana]
MKTKLKFAHPSVRLHPDDLPFDYEPTEIYRGLDTYVSARRATRRKKRREARRMHRRVNQEDDATEDARKDETEYDSDSSSSSSDDSGPMVISRLRALFDSSDSSSSSSSLSSSEDSSSDEDASFESAATSRRSTDMADRTSIRSGRSRRDNAATPTLSSSFSPWTPRISALTGSRRRKRRRRRRQPKGDKQHMSKSIRMARRNARRLRELAGGITEYTIFTPTIESQPDAFTTQSWKTIRKRLDDHFQYLIQADGHAGDMGLPVSTDMVTASAGISPSILEEGQGDLALPPPALDVNPPDLPNKESTWDEQESQTGRHMSDIPLTPYFRSPLSGDIARSPMPFFQLAKRQDNHPSSAGPILRVVEEENELDNLTLPDAALDLNSNSVPSPTPIQEPIPPPVPSSLISQHMLRRNPLWLDIRCPTYRVMQQLSLQFPLHPLTVEDILKQEQREKVEHFERHGYYFVVVRALDEHYFRFTQPEEAAKDKVEQPSPSTLERQSSSHKSGKDKQDILPSMRARRQIEMVKSEDAKEGLEGLGAGSVSIYMVVFEQGVLTFHFEDMSSYLKQVRDCIMNADTPIPRNADWIVHFLYDTIVDAFSPYVSFLQNEVDYIDSLLQELGLRPFTTQRNASKPARKLLRRSIFKPSLKARKAAKKMTFESLTNYTESNAEHIQYLRLRAEKLKQFSTYDAIEQSLFILHLTRVREVVMGLNRLLLPKSDVVRVLRKRIMEIHRDASEDAFIALYFDDVADHIASMMVQLQERESGLNTIHSSFLTRAFVTEKRFNLQKVRFLANVSMFVTIIFGIQLLCSAFSMNVLVPDDNSFANEDPEDIDPYRVYREFYGFGGVIGGLALIPILVYAYAGYLKRRSRQTSKLNSARF